MSEKKITPIGEYSSDSAVNSWLLIQEISLRETRDGKPYLDILFRDRSGIIRGKMWRLKGAEREKFSPGQAVAVSGRIDTFNDELQLNVDKMVVVNEELHRDRGFSWDLLLPRSSRDPNELFDDIVEKIAALKSEHLQRLCLMIFEENHEKLLRHPASLILHHATLGGYLEHVWSMLKLAENAAGLYSVDEDLLTVGILLHDIGKLEELKGFPDNQYTDEGNFIGHIVLGFQLVGRYADRISDFPEDIRLKLGHIILSHQGEYEYQSPKKPAIPEAILVHYFDELDARMNMFNSAVDRDAAKGNTWTSRRNIFGVPLFSKA